MATFRGFCDDSGHVALDDRNSWLEHIRVTYPGQEFEISDRAVRRTRTYEQLKYWFGVPMTILSEYTGYTKMQMHYLCLAQCFGVIHDETTGLDLPVVPASRHLTTRQFGELIEWCPPWAFETYDGRITIPMPNEVDLALVPGVA